MGFIILGGYLSSIWSGLSLQMQACRLLKWSTVWGTVSPHFTPRAQAAVLGLASCFQTAAARQYLSHPASLCIRSPYRKSGGCLMCGVVAAAPTVVKVCPWGKVWKHKPAARGFWKIRDGSEVNCMQWVTVSLSDHCWWRKDCGIWEMPPALPQHVALAACGCWEKVLQFLPLNAFVCTCGCINISLMLGLVFMDFTEKLCFREDKTHNL